MFFFLFFHNIFHRKLNLKQFFLLIHFPTHKTTIQRPIPLILILLRSKLQIQMLLWLGLILNYRQHNKNIRMRKILNILNFRNLKTFRRLILPQRLHSHLVKFENHKRLTKSIDHHTYIILTYLLFTPQYWQLFSKILHNRILKDLLQFILILVV